MSLFGGQASLDRFDSESLSSSPSVSDSSTDDEDVEVLESRTIVPLPEGISDAQVPDHSSQPLPSSFDEIDPALLSPQREEQKASPGADDEEKLYEASDEEGEGEDEDEDDEPVRPNRFPGKSSTWRGHTVADRRIAESLDRIESGDLSAHLYNAHALKRRVRLPESQLKKIKNWQSKDLWLKRGEELEFLDPFGELQRELVPSKGWTAWPLGGGRAPGPEEVFGREREHEGWMVGGLGEREVGDELREEMLATFLKLAKEKWRERESEGEEEIQEYAASRAKRRSRSRPEIKRSKSQRPNSRASTQAPPSPSSDVEMQDNPAVTTDASKFSDTESEAPSYSKARNRPKSSPPYSKPSIMTDDDKARRMLQPTINSVLSKLDQLALAIRRTRLNHFGRTYTAASDGSVSGRSRSVSRARSASRASAASRATTSRPTKGRGSGRNKSSRAHVGRDSDSDQQVDEDSNASNDSLEGTTSKRRRGESKGARSRTPNRDPFARFGPMDWSEVLGIASMVGWDEGAVARTAQRCASLFNEGMAFRVFDEGLAAKPIAAPVQYIPETIPAPPSTEAEHARPTSAKKRPAFENGSLRCPHIDCWGHYKEFAASHRVTEHMIRVHEYDPRTNNSDNEDNKYGGVHIDGFMQEINPKQGWLGRGRSKSGGRAKRKKTGSSGQGSQKSLSDEV